MHGIWAIPRGTADVDMNCFISSHSDDAICDLELLEKLELSFCDPTGMPITKILSIEIMQSRSIYNGLLRDKQMNLFFTNGTPSAKVAEERRVAVQVGSRRITYLDTESRFRTSLLCAGRDI